MKTRSWLSLIMAVALSMALLAGCAQPAGTTEATPTPVATSADPSAAATPAPADPGKTYKYDTLVLGSTEFNGVFNEFFYNTGYDHDVSGLTALNMLANDRYNADIPEACDFDEPELIRDADGNILFTKYTFRLKEGLVFSDGTPVTADDIIFTYKVFLDPAYDGLATLWKIPIVGVNEYRYDDPNYSAAIKQIEDDMAARYASDVITWEDFLEYAKETDLDGWWDGDPAGDIGNGQTWSEYATDEGFDKELAAIDATSADQMFELIAKIEYENYKDAYDVQGYRTNKATSDYALGGLASGVKIPEIEGIKKIDEYTVEVTIEGINPVALMNLGRTPIMPQHYYGVGFSKGNLDGCRTNVPLGGGPYVFQSFEDNVVTLTANPLYYKGEPKIAKIKYQVFDSSAKFEAVVQGDIDITDPTASTEMVQQVEDAGLHYELILNNGYGYVGINADRITDKNVRKGIMHLLNRIPAVQSYYGDLAEVIERPISKVMWAYPQDATPYYDYDPDKALECFLAAGYTQETVSGATVLMKDGKQLRIEPWMTDEPHPVNSMMTQLKTDLEALGAICEVNVVPWSQLSDSYRKGLVDMWAAAWVAGADPDMYQIYHSTQVESGNNPYHIRSAELDELIMAGLNTLDIAERTRIYQAALDIVMDEAVEMPFYQRCNMYVFNPEVIDIDTLPENMTPFYEYFAEVETLELH